MKMRNFLVILYPKSTNIILNLTVTFTQLPTLKDSSWIVDIELLPSTLQNMFTCNHDVCTFARAARARRNTEYACFLEYIFMFHLRKNAKVCL